MKTLLFQIKSVRHTCVKSQLSKTLTQLYDQRLSKIFPTTTYKRKKNLARQRKET